jgi:UDP-N-acetylmuramoyl-L-alanyl-D-glutamate--2,6-diaminopimelate ligase
MQMLHEPLEAARWLRQRVRGELRTDSRQVQAGDGFIAWPGAARDARQHLAEVLQRGAAACVLEAEGSQAWQALIDEDASSGVERLAALPQLKARSGLVADAYYEHPSDEVALLAITGTNGKTSSAWWLAQALGSAVLGQACGVIGTLGVGRPPELVSTGLTTPDPVLLQRELRRFAQAGVRHCAIEASSIGLAEHRLDGTRIRVAVFTNFTQDHLDYHGSMDAYWHAKAALFTWPGLAACVVNIDDPQGAVLAQSLQGRATALWTCSRRQSARLQARPLPGEQGLAFEVVEDGVQAVRLQTRLIGDYNIDNLLGVIGALRALGAPLEQAVAACRSLSAVPGRMQQVDMAESGASASPMVVVDYAHTPDAVEQALQALRPLAAVRGGRLWCVLGCGGDRDPSKRAPMARAAEHGADRVLLTSDNPRSESPEAILAQMALGLSQAQAVPLEPDRARAIALAIEQAQPQDVVLIAGKGHEAYQEIAGVRHPFSDEAVARAALQARHAAKAGGVA